MEKAVGLNGRSVMAHGFETVGPGAGEIAGVEKNAPAWMRDRFDPKQDWLAPVACAARDAGCRRLAGIGQAIISS